MRDALTGLVAVVQRTDGALRLNVHLHCLGLDGVYVRDADGTLVFHELPTPSCAEVASIARRTAQRLHQAFRKQGRRSPWDDEAAFVDSGETDAFSSQQPGLFACYQAAALGIAVSGERAGQPLLRVVAGAASSEPTDKSSKSEAQPVAEALGVSDHFLPAERIDPWLGLGLGYEWLLLGQTSDAADLDISTTARGFEFANLQAGVDFKVAEGAALGPFYQLLSGSVRDRVSEV